MERLEWLFGLVRGGHPDPHLQRRVRNLGVAVRRGQLGGRRPKALRRNELLAAAAGGAAAVLECGQSSNGALLRALLRGQLDAPPMQRGRTQIRSRVHEVGAGGGRARLGYVQLITFSMVK